MIKADFKNHNGLTIEGSISEVTAECILVMKEIYKRNSEVYNSKIAMGILTNMLIRAIQENQNEEDVNWEASEEEKLAYTE